MVKKYLCQLISHAKNRDLGKMLGCLCLPVFWAVLGVGTLALFLFPFVIGGLWAMLVLIGMPWMLGGWDSGRNFLVFANKFC